MNNDKISADLLREETVTMGAKPLQDEGSVTEWKKSSFEETHEKTATDDPAEPEKTIAVGNGADPEIAKLLPD